jgi:plasmid stability protein
MVDMKVTIAFSDDDLYRRVKIHAAASGRQVRDIVEEALARWLEAIEDEEDVRAAGESIEEYEAAGGVDADAFFRRMVSEGRVEYDAG